MTVAGLVSDLRWTEHCWIRTHMVEGTARHVGHLDLLREQLDGTTGSC
jgi:hypothetical protein